MQAIINIINNDRSHIQEIAGNIVIIEKKLRMLAEVDPFYRSEVHRIAAKTRFKHYWDCDLWVLCEALLFVFKDKLGPNQKKIFEEFKNPRNKMLHSNMIDLMEALGLPTEGQETLASGGRNALEWPDDPEDAVKRGLYAESIKSSHRQNNYIQEFRSIFNIVEPVINALLTKSSIIKD